MQKRKPKIWAEIEDEFLKDNLEYMTNDQIAEKLGRTTCSVRARQHILGLRRSKNAVGKKNKKGCFQKGNTPWNKGIKGTHFSPDTEFKAGRIPHNTKYDGCISVRYSYGIPYKYIRLSLGKWTEMHRFVWETYHGKKIPPKHVVRFKDGDTMNCHISNLELISRGTHARRNWKPPRITDEYAAWNLSKKQPFTKEDALKYPELIELQKIRLHHNRELRYARQKNTADFRSDNK